LQRIESVTAADIQRVARSTFRRDRLVAVAVGPLSGVEKRLRAAVEGAL
jgi:predicted Zn-dependent peptidase